MRVLLALAAAASFVGLGLRVRAAGGDAADLAAPVAVSVGGVPIDLSHDSKFDFRNDNSFPWVGDFDGDGKLDLLVGQGGRGQAEGGRLRIYRNLDGKAEPRLAEPIWFHDKVPTGVTPLG
jgi:FG-GAP repeat